MPTPCSVARAQFSPRRSKALHVQVDRSYTFDTVEQAHAALEERKQVGKAVIEPGVS